jgi:hypothetical protein
VSVDEGVLAHLLFRGWDRALGDVLGDGPDAPFLQAIFPAQDFIIWPADAF